MAKYKIAVTGASGMVGFHVVAALVAEGHDVVAIVRPTSNTANLQKLGGVAIKKTELDNSQGLLDAIAACDVVVHAAGAVDPLAPAKYIRQVNVQGTGAVLEASAQNKVKQFIFVSSLSVITGQGDQYEVTEAAPYRYCGEAYADSKIDAEKLVLSYSGKSDMGVTALRPGFIYGPGERAWMPRLIGNIKAGRAALLDGGNKETNVIYIGNLCQAISLAIMNRQTCGQVYNLTDGQKISKKLLFDTIADGLSLPRVTRVVPAAVVKVISEVVSPVAPLLPVSIRAPLSRFSRAAFRLAGVNQGFSIEKAESELNYVERIAFADGMAKTLPYFAAIASGDKAIVGSDYSTAVK
jgi:nucleoside-diphosphate-sugar epimerase